ncbi:hypothetical protein GCM10027053_49210 [Intrasporangium mesophilum]
MPVATVRTTRTEPEADPGLDVGALDPDACGVVVDGACVVVSLAVAVVVAVVTGVDEVVDGEGPLVEHAAVTKTANRAAMAHATRPRWLLRPARTCDTRHLRGLVSHGTHRRCARTTLALGASRHCDA